MKRIKKTLGALCALVLVFALALAVPAEVFAETTYSLTVRNTGETSHTLELYQIFKGDLHIDDQGRKVLSNVVWGSGVDAAAAESVFGSAAEKAESITDEGKARDFVVELINGPCMGEVTTSSVGAGETATFTGLVPGYYLVKDSDNSQYGDNSAYTAYILQVVGDVETQTKLDIPSVVKKVQDINDSLDGDISDNPWADAADHDIGDDVPFEIIGTLPSNYDEYGTYSYTFTDEMSAGLTYNDDARVFVINGSVETEITASAQIQFAPSAAGTILTISVEDLKALAVTTDMNSRIVVRYTAELNEEAVIGGAGNVNSVYLTYSNDPNPGGSGTGTTPVDTAVVFTYGFVVNKTDEYDNPLAGAGFTLFKKDADGNWNEIAELEAGSATEFSFSGLDDGTYKLVESTTPAGHNTINDIEFTITAEIQGAPAEIISLLGGSTEGETVDLDSATQATVSLSDGLISTKIVNKSGSILPSTGGVGTTLFYIIGGVLAVGALVLIITKKRIRAED